MPAGARSGPEAFAMRMRTNSCRAALRLLLPLLIAAPLALSGCGSGGCCDEFWGDVYVDNLTDLSTVEDVDFFETARFGDPWTGNLLATPLPPGFVDFIGTYDEDYYDAYAELELGDVVEWFDVFVGYGENVYFEIY